MEHFKRSLARDFRINGATLDAALKEDSSSEDEDDEGEEEDQEEVNGLSALCPVIVNYKLYFRHAFGVYFFGGFIYWKHLVNSTKYM